MVWYINDPEATTLGHWGQITPILYFLYTFFCKYIKVAIANFNPISCGSNDPNFQYIQRKYSIILFSCSLNFMKINYESVQKNTWKTDNISYLLNKWFNYTTGSYDPHITLSIWLKKYMITRIILEYLYT